jgi:hypothetical protein
LFLITGKHCPILFSNSWKTQYILEQWEFLEINLNPSTGFSKSLVAAAAAVVMEVVVATAALVCMAAAALVYMAAAAALDTGFFHIRILKLNVGNIIE